MVGGIKMAKISNWKKIGYLSWYNNKFQENKGRYLRVISSSGIMSLHDRKREQGPFYVEVKDRGNVSYRKLLGPIPTGISATEEAIDYMRSHPKK